MSKVINDKVQYLLTSYILNFHPLNKVQVVRDSCKGVIITHI